MNVAKFRLRWAKVPGCEKWTGCHELSILGLGQLASIEYHESEDGLENGRWEVFVKTEQGETIPMIGPFTNTWVRKDVQRAAELGVLIFHPQWFQESAS